MGSIKYFKPSTKSVEISKTEISLIEKQSHSESEPLNFEIFHR